MKISPHDPAIRPDPKKRRRRDESERRLRAVVKAAPVPLFITRADDGEILYANSEAGSLLGLPPETLTGRKITEFYVAPKKRKTVLATLEKKGFIRDYEIELKKATGEVILALISSNPIVYEEDLALLTVVSDTTERQHTQEALLESEKRFRGAFEAAPHGMAIVGINGAWLKVNQALCTIVGYDEEELLATNFQAVTHQDDLQKDLALARQMLDGEISSCQMEKRYIHKAGHAVWVLLAASLVRDSRDQPSHFVVQCYDLTERKRIEEALLESNRRFQGIIDFSPLLISIKGVDSRYKLINKNYAAYLGIQSEDISGKTIAERYPGNPAVVRQTEEEDRELIKTGEPQQDRITTRSKGGEEHHFLVTKFLLRDAAGQPNEICGIAMDITARKQAEQALEESQRRLQGILDYSPIYITIKGADGRYKIFNRHYEVSSGIKSEDVVGKTNFERPRADPERPAEIEREDKELLRTGKPKQNFEVIRVFKGEARQFLTTKSPLMGPDGKPNEIVSIGIDITERKRAEEALREREEQIRLLLETVGEGIYGLDTNGNATFVNPAAARMVGYSVEELIGRPMHARIHHSHPDSTPYPAERCPIHLTLRDGISHTVKDDVLWRKDGTSFPVEYTSTPIHKEGKLVGTVVTFRDITQRKEIEAKLRESEARFRMIAEQAPIPIAINRLSDSRILYANPRMNAYFGLPPGRMTGMVGADCYQNPKERKGTVTRILEKGYLHDTEIKLKRPDGTPMTAIASYSRIDFDGNDAVIAVLQDVTELKEAEAALRESERRFRAVVEGAPIPLVIAHVSDGKVIFANAHAAGTFGFDSASEITGKHIHAFYQNPEERHKIMRLVHEQGKVQGLELQLKRKDGTPMTVLLASHLLTLEGEKVVLSGFQDITALEEAEEKFRRAQKMEAIGQLTGGVAHDFNNLLGVVIGNLELLEERVKDEAVQKLANRALGAADRGAMLIRRLLIFSRKQNLAPQPTNLNRLVVGMTELFEHSLAKTVEVRIELADELWPVMVDPSQLETAILNLALNAQDAMPNGGRLTIATRNVTAAETGLTEGELAAGRYVALVVSDNGIGIPKENLARVFEPFFTTKGIGKGSGLGLSVAYGFIRQSNGHIRIESAPGAGTRVRVYLPATEKSPSLPATPSLPKDRFQGEGETILLVEDDIEMRRLAKRLLTDLNYRVIEAEDALSAQKILATDSGRIDLLFTDVVLPRGLSGIDLMRQVKERYPKLKVLLTSGYMAEFPGRDGIANLKADLVEKPYRRHVLAQKIRAVLADNRPRTAPSS